MVCEVCGLSVLVKDGVISPHLRPQDLSPCVSSAPIAANTTAPHAGHAAAKKAPAKAAAKKPAHEAS